MAYKQRRFKPKSKAMTQVIKSGKNVGEMFRSGIPYNVKPEPFPRILHTRMKFAEARELTQVFADTAVFITYRVNSIWDPNVTIGATSRTTVGHTAMTTLYDDYLVTGCKIVLSFYDSSTAGNVVGVKVRIAGAGSVSGQSVRQLIEQPLVYTKRLSNLTGANSKQIVLYVKPWSCLGISKLEYMTNTSKYSANMAANPSAADGVAFIDVFLVNKDIASPAMEYQIKMIYNVTLFHRKDLTSAAF